MLALISPLRGPAYIIFRRVLLIVFTLYNILSGNITVFDGLAAVRGVYSVLGGGIIHLKCSNMEMDFLVLFFCSSRGFFRTEGCIVFSD